MNIPTNGRVVVIDDNIEKEALPLLNALAKQGVATRFYNGDQAGLPEKPYGGIRLIFLDIKLRGMELMNEPDAIVNALMPRLERIVSANNGPYVVFGWTKHPQYLTALCESLNPRPMLWLNMEKSLCIKDDVCDMALILNALKKSLRASGAFKLLFLWEHLVHEAIFSTVNDFRLLLGNAPNDSNALKRLMYGLAKAGLEEQIKGKTTAEVIANALLAANGSLQDLLENSVSKLDNYKEFGAHFFRGNRSPADATANAKINTRLHLANDQIKDAVPGNIYKPWNKQLREMTAELIGNSLKHFEAAERQKAIAYVMETSAFCDHAQNKWTSHRLLPGFLLPAQLKKKAKSKKNDALFFTPEFILEGVFNEPFIIVFHFGYLDSCTLRSLTRRKSSFRLKKDIVIDIQSRLARHVSRPGILAL